MIHPTIFYDLFQKRKTSSQGINILDLRICVLSFKQPVLKNKNMPGTRIHFSLCKPVIHQRLKKISTLLSRVNIFVFEFYRPNFACPFYSPSMIVGLQE